MTPPCPFCSSSYLRAVFNVPRNHWNIMCMSCHALGPEGRTQQSAEHKWKIRFTFTLAGKPAFTFTLAGKPAVIKYPGFLAHDFPALVADEALVADGDEDDSTEDSR